MIMYSIWCFHSFISFIPMSHTISVITKSGACYFYTHQTSGACAGVCACNLTYQMGKTSLFLTLFLSVRKKYPLLMPLYCLNDSKLGKYVWTFSDITNQFLLLFLENGFSDKSHRWQVKKRRLSLQVMTIQFNIHWKVFCFMS